MREQNIAEIKKALERIAEKGTVVQISEIKKNNGVVLIGAILKKEGQTVAPAIFIDDKLDEMENGDMTAQEVAEWVMYVNKTNADKSSKYADGSRYLNKEYFLENVLYKLVNTEKNKELLESVPHKELLDLSAVYRVIVGKDEDEFASIQVTNSMMDVLGISLEELDESAKKNTKAAGFSVQSMAQMIAEQFEIPEADMANDFPPLYYMGNKFGIHGASIMLYTNYFEELANKLGDELYILPSSIYDVIAIAASNMGKEWAKDMVCIVNNTELPKDEVLSYKVYKYTRSNGCIEIA